MSDWISVRDSMPNKSTPSRSKAVLIYCPEIECQFTACYNFENKQWEYFAVGSVDVNNRVSHWKPLGANPED